MSASRTARLEVPGALDGERVDRGIALLTGMSRSQAAKLVEAGGAVVGGKVVTMGSHRLRAGEILEVPLEDGLGSATAYALPGPGAGELRGGKESLAARAPSPIAHVVHADDEIIVVDKPAGLVVHPGAGNSSGTLVDQLRESYPDIVRAGPDLERPGIVHRLDKGTSGLLVVARTARAREDLVAQMAARAVRRRYLAVVHGLVAAGEGIVEAPVGRSTRQRVKMAVVRDGRFARTRYTVLARSSAPAELTLVECRLETGRTHQVRVHMAAIGHPLLGDNLYAAAGFLREGRLVAPALQRPFLHAAELGFRHPGTGEQVRFDSPLPDDLRRLLTQFGLEA